MTKDIIERYRQEFRRLWGNITKENQHLTTEKIEDLISKAIASTQEERDRGWEDKIKNLHGSVADGELTVEEIRERLSEILSDTKTN